jgi:hypothetical protein
MMESLFGYNSKGVVKHEDVKSKSPSPSKHVLEHKRLQNITILLKALNATSDQVCHAITIGIFIYKIKVPQIYIFSRILLCKGAN